MLKIKVSANSPTRLLQVESEALPGVSLVQLLSRRSFQDNLAMDHWPNSPVLQHPLCLARRLFPTQEETLVRVDGEGSAPQRWSSSTTTYMILGRGQGLCSHQCCKGSIARMDFGRGGLRQAALVQVDNLDRHA